MPPSVTPKIATDDASEAITKQKAYSGPIGIWECRRCATRLREISRKGVLLSRELKKGSPELVILLGLFTLNEMKAAFAATGLTVQYDDQGIFGRGLYIAEHRRPTKVIQS